MEGRTNLGILAALAAVLAVVGFLVRPGSGGDVVIDGARRVAPPAAEVRAPLADAAAPIADAPAPVAAAAAQVEGRPPLDRTDLAAELPPGELEVVVLAGDEPVAGASVHVLAVRRGEMLEDFESATEGVLRATTDERGVVRFHALAPAYYAIGVVAPDERRATSYQRLAAGQPTRRQVVAFGDSAIEGTVHGTDGSPSAGERVTVVQREPLRAARAFMAATTAEDGAYRISGLAGGEFRVYVRSGGDGGRSIDVALAPGDSRSVDFGSAEPPATWSGKLRLRSGAAVEDVDSFGVREASRGESFAIHCDDGGRFSAQVAPGSYRAQLTVGSRELDLGEVDLASGRSVHDLVVPGACLAGRIVRLAIPGQASSESASPPIEVVVEPRDTAGADPIRATAHAGTYTVLGLAPGRYVVRTEPTPLSGVGARGIQVEIDGSRERVVLDLIVSDD